MYITVFAYIFETPIYILHSCNMYFCCTYELIEVFRGTVVAIRYFATFGGHVVVLYQTANHVPALSKDHVLGLESSHSAETVSSTISGCAMSCQIGVKPCSCELVHFSSRSLGSSVTCQPLSRSTLLPFRGLGKVEWRRSNCFHWSPLGWTDEMEMNGMLFGLDYLVYAVDPSSRTPAPQKGFCARPCTHMYSVVREWQWVERATFKVESK